MQFTHEYTMTLDATPEAVYADWTDAGILPSRLTHVRAIARGDHEDLARLIIMIAGRHIEFPAQRTMCAANTICWQSLGEEFLYVLTVEVQREKKGGGSHVTVTVAYDPPGFLIDLIELGTQRVFKQQFEADIKHYASSVDTPDLLGALGMTG
ncbi:hypothetical protein CCAX7_29000 [Capsulimonas corticalis]|uniref:Uncharacterized protein n=1 Tax=Capsulimonas corticalis TaxID=2219043 RepID=A0A402CT73_9BACT|nr:hypothetical protein [Capsulimonas corticalis]BDI30849.1 hypothetical protein CCAX7_29000 [Capsulimonas corticalis]